VRIDTRWATNAADIRGYAAELAALAPDVVLAHGASAVAAMLQVEPSYQSRTQFEAGDILCGLVHIGPFCTQCLQVSLGCTDFGVGFV
jgi:hypothetical protein